MQQPSGGGARPRIYLAGPLFSDAERAFNERVTAALEKWVDVYLPQRDGQLMEELIRSGVSPDRAACRVFRHDLTAIRDASCVISVLDGRAIDEGVAFEIGVAFCHGKRCVGLQTDPRRLAPWGNNPMIAGALEHVFDSVDVLLGWVESELAGAIVG